MLCRAIRSSIIQPWKCTLGAAGRRLMSSQAHPTENEGDGSTTEVIDESYGVRKTVEWLQDRQDKFNHGYRFSKMVDPAVNTGMFINFPEGLSLSVETHPVVCSSDFAETAILPTSDTAPDLDVDKFPPRLVGLRPMGYNEDKFTMRHKEPVDLFRHITKFMDVLEDAQTVEGVVQLAGGELIDLNRDKREHILVDTVEMPNSGVVSTLIKQALY